MKPDDKVTITKQEYLNLLISDAEYGRLKAAGVDNWDHGDAFEGWEEERSAIEQKVEEAN